MNEGGFSIRRFLGVSAALSRLFRASGIPPDKQRATAQTRAVILKLFGLKK